MASWGCNESCSAENLVLIWCLRSSTVTFLKEITSLEIQLISKGDIEWDVLGAYICCLSNNKL